MVSRTETIYYFLSPAVHASPCTYIQQCIIGEHMLLGADFTFSWLLHKLRGMHDLSQHITSSPILILDTYWSCTSWSYICVLTHTLVITYTHSYATVQCDIAYIYVSINGVLPILIAGLVKMLCGFYENEILRREVNSLGKELQRC